MVAYNKPQSSFSSAHIKGVFMSFNTKLIDLLKTNHNLVDDDGELILSAVQDKAWKIDHELVRLLLQDQEVKEKFFTEIESHWVFNINTFLEYISQKNFLDNSYTRFRNRVGLTIDGKYLRERGEVALVWPYKDGVLEGGQTREDKKRKEIFFNEILAQDEINRLLDPKVLTKFVRYTADGKQAVKDFKRDENGLIRENLTFKGNNLLALHILKTQFRGQVKLIYIDPPYNTGNDSFGYNDNFNHSTWLTFMKNRLEIAKELLATDGVIFVHLDYNESHYCKILLDELFGKDKFINEIIWRRKQATSFGNSKFGIVTDSILFYSKTEIYTFNPTYSLDDENTKKYIEERFVYEDGNGEKFMKSPLVNSLYRPNLKYVFNGINPPANGWLYSKERMQELYDNDELVIPDDPNARIYRKIFLSTYKGQVIQSLWADIPIVNPMANERTDFDTQKPEKLLERIINAVTNAGDLVLDFSIGSGTTLAAAHKMGRQYIGIEQMDYIKDYVVERLIKVIGKKLQKNGNLFDELEYDQDGISKSVNWKGGGDFIYCELMKYNEAFIERIQEAKNSEELLRIWQEMSRGSFLNWYINPETPEEAIKDFVAIGNEENGFEKQKHLLAEFLDKNQLYVNLSEIDDAQFDVCEEDKALNKAFYGETYNA
jgi:adenine-specific DNA-methyltransferase